MRSFKIVTADYAATFECRACFTQCMFERHLRFDVCFMPQCCAEMLRALFDAPAAECAEAAAVRRRLFTFSGAYMLFFFARDAAALRALQPRAITGLQQRASRCQLFIRGLIHGVTAAAQSAIFAAPCLLLPREVCQYARLFY